jgi:hypothetical protein
MEFHGLPLGVNSCLLYKIYDCVEILHRGFGLNWLHAMRKWASAHVSLLANMAFLMPMTVG